MRNEIEYEDEFCCEELECIFKDEIVDTYGGDFTYMDLYKCQTHNKFFAVYHGCGRFGGTEEINEEEYNMYYRMHM